VIAIRGLTNERGEFLITTLPVADVNVAPTAGFLFPHYADGGGWTTQVVLVNTTDSTISGSVEFLGTAVHVPIIPLPQGPLSALSRPGRAPLHKPEQCASRRLPVLPHLQVFRFFRSGAAV